MTVEEIATELEKLENKFKSVHQLSVSYYQLLIQITPYLKSEIILRHIMPVLRRAMQKANYQCRQIITQYFADITKGIEHGALRLSIKQFMTDVMAVSPLHKDRLQYIDFCLLVMHCMSKQYFKEQFLPQLSQLWKGKTTSELYKLCKNGVVLRKMLHNIDEHEINFLISNLEMCSNSHSKNMEYVREAASNSLRTITDSSFTVTDENQMQLIENEKVIRANESKAVEEIKKQEIEMVIQRAREEVTIKLGGKVNSSFTVNI